MNTTLLQITAQYEENYGAHSWDGQGECPQHWKPKGGQMFTLRVDSDDFMYAEEQCIKAIATLLEKQSNNYERYWYVDHELVFSEPIVLDDAEFETELRAECEKAFK
jgi:hypothetical protein